MRESDDLTSIYIRARIGDHLWQSRSLRELIESGHTGQIGQWFVTRCLGAVGLEEGAVVTEEAVRAMVAFIERSMHPLIRVRQEFAQPETVGAVARGLGDSSE